MSKLKWVEIVKSSKTGELSDSFKDTRYKAVYEKTFLFEYKKFGRGVWGSDKLEVRIRWEFVIAPRPPASGKKTSPYQLVIRGLSSINGHIYISSVVEGKKISQEICDYFIKSFKSVN